MVTKTLQYGCKHQVVFCLNSKITTGGVAAEDLWPSTLPDGLSIVFFNPNTANIPSSNKYGVCVYSNHCDGQNKWINATAYQTDGTVCISNKVNSAAWSNWVAQPTRAEVDALSSKISLEGSAQKLTATSNNNSGDTCFFMFDRSDEIRYKISFGTSKLLFQKYENGTWTTVWEK